MDHIERIKNELRHLQRVKSILDIDHIIPLRLDIVERGLTSRQLVVTISGIQSLIKNPDSSTQPTAATFTVLIELSSGYPWTAMPTIQFGSPVPFHPHVFASGNICWGKQYANPQPSLALADWIRGVVEYLQYNQEPGGFLDINANDPANTEASAWWKKNSRSISRYVLPIDMARLRFWIDQARG